MKKKHIIISIVVAVIVLTGAIGWQMYNKGPVDVRKSRGIAVETTELYQEFAANRAEAREKYAGKILEVTGIVNRIEENIQQQQVILLKTGEPGAFINCTMEEKMETVVGEIVKIKGICSGMGEGDADLGIKGDVYIMRSYPVN